MLTYHVERSRVIHQSKSIIHAILTDFHEMQKWSPWLIIEPDATVTFSDLQGDVGASQTWQGELVGAGSMELTEVHDALLVYRLQFLKPFRSQSKVTFELHEEDEGVTKVSWNMYGRMPWYLFFMTKMMKTYIGMDYERGLSMLKEYAETGKIASALELMGVGELDEIHYMGIENSSRLKEIGKVMGKDFETLGQYINTHRFPEETQVFSIYRTFDFKNDTSSFVSCVSIDKDYAVPEPFIRGKVARSGVLNVRHIGKYDHLGNAWSLAMNHVRHYKMRLCKKPFGYEFYLNSPMDTPAEALITEVMLPLK